MHCRRSEIEDGSSDPLLTRKEVCFYRGRISRWTLWRWQRAGLRIDGGRVRMSAVEKFLERMKDEGGRMKKMG